MCVCVCGDEMGKWGWRESSRELKMWREEAERFSFEIKIYSSHSLSTHVHEHIHTHTHMHTKRNHLQRKNTGKNREA